MPRMVAEPAAPRDDEARGISAECPQLTAPLRMRTAFALLLLVQSAASVVMRARTIVCKMPSLSPLPPALAASDGSHTFTYDSVQRRLPLIIESVIDKNAYDDTTVGALRALASEIATGAPLKPLVSPSEEWATALAPHLSAGDTWFSTPWFLVENYLYKRMLELTDGPTGAADPFAAQKAESLEGSASAFAGMLAAGLADGEVAMPQLVATSLWGNLADLSLSAGAALIAPTDASAGASAEAVGPATAWNSSQTPPPHRVYGMGAHAPMRLPARAGVQDAGGRHGAAVRGHRRCRGQGGAPASALTSARLPARRPAPIGLSCTASRPSSPSAPRSACPGDRGARQLRPRARLGPAAGGRAAALRVAARQGGFARSSPPSLPPPSPPPPPSPHGG